VGFFKNAIISSIYWCSTAQETVMATNFQSVLDSITSLDFTCILARKTALSAHNELYHFQMVIHEFGEERVLQETANILRTRYRYSFSEAYNEASIRVRALLELCGGDKTFRTVRDNLRT